MQKKLEDMTMNELLDRTSKQQDKLSSKPRKLAVDSDGAILLDPKNKKDREWLEDDEEFDII